MSGDAGSVPLFDYDRLLPLLANTEMYKGLDEQAAEHFRVAQQAARKALHSGA